MHTDTAPLSVTGVAKTYDGKRVLADVDLTLQPCEMFGLIGLNGAGKTTLIKIILDLINADEGTARLFGHSAKTVKAREYLSYLPEKFQPPRQLVGYEYLELSLSYYKRKLDRDAARAKAAQLDLDPDVLGRRIATYSKGMGQKLGLVGAFLIDAPLLILDEPMSGLDPRARIMLKDALLEARKVGKTIFFSSHILSDIDEICDRIGVIHEGKLYYLGTPQNFKQNHGEAGLEKAFLRLLETTSAEKAAA